MTTDERFTVLARLKETLKNKNIAELANEFGITISINSKINKGWIGQTLDKLANTEGINAQMPDGVDYELKSVQFILRNGELTPKETMAITMFNPEKIVSESFEASALWHKLSRLILVGHVYLENRRDLAQVKFISPVDVSDRKLKDEIKAYWEQIKQLTIEGKIANYSSKGTSNGYIQLRTKGSGKSQSRCPITNTLFNTRAFYATKTFLRYVRGNLG